MAGSNILVVYFSRSGTTRKIAESLATALGSDVAVITERKSRAGIAGYIRSVWEARRQRPAIIGVLDRDVSDYDLVVVGTPVWAWSVSSPVRAFLAQTKTRLPEVAFFCTLGGAGASRAFAQMHQIVGKAPRALCAITAPDLASGSYREQIATFVKALAPLMQSPQVVERKRA